MVAPDCKFDWIRKLGGPNFARVETGYVSESMESLIGTEPRSDKTTLDSLQFTDEIQRLMCAPQDTGSSFTALLELPAPQAVELLHSPESVSPNPSNSKFTDRAGNFPVFAAAESGGKSSTATTSSNNSSATLPFPVKSEPAETTSSEPLVSDPAFEKLSAKRKDREKVKTESKSSAKKTKTAANERSEEAGKLPFVHVRARRGQATDSHSLAERARRQKINARMKLLQELVPGCDKISGTALVLDEIINHVQFLQRQVEFLSMRLAAVNPRVDFNLDNILTGDGGMMDSRFPSIVMPVMWPEAAANGWRQQQYQQQWLLGATQQPVLGREEVCHDYASPENPLLGYNLTSSAANVPPTSLKMEL